MDEKEKQDIENRANLHANISSDYSEIVPRKRSYIQGALDQDPISRKKRTEEIIQAIDEAEQQSWTRLEIIKFIKALP